MHVTNTEPCTLVIGSTKIGYRETKPVDPKWEKRCQELADRGALRIAGKDEPATKKPDAAPTRRDLLALLLSLTDAERAELLAPKAGADGAPASAPKSEPDGAPASAPKSEPAPTEAVDLSDPIVFAAAHVATCRAFVKGCSNLDTLIRLADEESRPSLVDAISQRVKQLEDAAKADAN
jgi:hypothetical protein